MNDTVVMTKFRSMCEAHDLTYCFSDDHSAWLKGEESMKKIKAFAKHLDEENVKEIWNSVVREKIIEKHWEEFYWSTDE